MHTHSLVLLLKYVQLQQFSSVQLQLYDNLHHGEMQLKKRKKISYAEGQLMITVKTFFVTLLIPIAFI